MGGRKLKHAWDPPSSSPAGWQLLLNGFSAHGDLRRDGGSGSPWRWGGGKRGGDCKCNFLCIFFNFLIFLCFFCISILHFCDFFFAFFALHCICIFLLSIFSLFFCAPLGGRDRNKVPFSPFSPWVSSFGAYILSFFRICPEFNMPNFS